MINGIITDLIIKTVKSVINELEFKKPKLKFEISNKEGEFIGKGDEEKKMFYHFKVVNQNDKYPVKKCKVSLVAIARKQLEPKEEYEELKEFNSIYTFFWTPSEVNRNIEKDFYKSCTFDFGHTTENDDRFCFGLNTPLTSLPKEYYIKKGESAIISLCIEAENSAPESQNFEMTWSGEWSNKPKEMKGRLEIKAIEEAKKKK